VPGRDDWSTLALTADADELREHILTGFRSGKPFTPYVPTLELPQPLDTVLDFGCGIGRNFPFLRSIAGRVAGFDLPPMVARCRALSTTPVDRLSDDWPQLAADRFDLIFASLVLQHVETDACRAYLRDFARMAPTVYLLTRIENDFGANVLDLVSENGDFDAGTVVDVEHDPDSHQLRVLARMSFDDARGMPGGTHCELLLRAKSVSRR
jgi:SAM-dependent methyltransferase